MLTNSFLKKHISRDGKSHLAPQDSVKRVSEAITKMNEKLEHVFEHSLSANISQLNQNIKKLIDLKLFESSHSREGLKLLERAELKKESRFEIIQVPIPKFDLMDKQRERKIQNWLGDMAKQVTSVTFEKFLKGEFNQKRARAYCSENMLRNILALQHQNQMKKNDIELINKTLRDTILPYIKTKYPQSQDAEVNLALNKRVIQIDDLQNNQNDLFYKSGIKFQYSQEKDYNQEIMEFLNFLIKLPEKKMDFEKTEQQKYKIEGQYKFAQEQINGVEEDTTLNQEFQYFFEQLFESLDEDQKIEKSSTQQNNKKIDLSKSQIYQRKKTKYQQNFSSYTKYLIGRKLSKNLKPFTLLEIKKGNLQLSNSALMRTVTKWCQQLRQNFSDPYKVAHKHGKFRMKDGSERYLSLNESNILYQLLSQRQKDIQKWLSIVREDNFQHQHDFSKMEELMKFNMEIFSEEQSFVGIFSSVTRQNYEAYLIGYLKELIHHLLEVMEDFEAVAYYREQWKSWNSSNLSQSIIDEGKKLKSRKAESKDTQVPNLITFKLSDLLRCKCSSRQMEIKAIYNEIERIDQKNPEILKIIKVKNRLERGTRDVLMNLMFRNQIVVEIQLAINTNKSGFIDCSDKFNHFIYELQRAEFGPISEMCNIWTNIDERANFFINEFKKRNISKNSYNSISFSDSLFQVEDKTFQNITLPFRCDKCNRFYSDTLFVGEHRKYEQDNLQICFPCLLAQLKTYDKIKDFLLPGLPILHKESQKYNIQPFRMNNENFPSSGLLISLKSKSKEVKHFKKIKRGNKEFVVQKSSPEQFNILGTVTNSKQKKMFLQENLVFDSDDVLRIQQQINQQDVVRSFFIPKLLQQTNLRKKNSIKINRQKMTDKVILQLTYPLREVKTVNFAQNRLEKIQTIVQKFPKLNTLILQNNKVSNLGGLENLNFLKQINLSSNNIVKIPEKLKCLKKIQKLLLRSNQISELPNSFCELIKLKELDVSWNQLKSLPEEFGQLSNLQIVALHYNKLVEIPQSCKKLKKLITLYLYTNELEKLPDIFGDMSSLHKLFLARNKLTVLPKTITKLNSLQILYINNNSITSLPENFCNLNQLFILSISFNQIKHLEKELLQLKNLVEFKDSANSFNEESQVISQGLHSICSQNMKKKQIKR